VTVPLAEPAKPRRPWLKWALTAIGLAGVVVVFAVVLPKIADYRAVWATIRDLNWEQLLLLAGATVLNLATYAPPFVAALPGLRFHQAFVLTQASTASTYVAPGGAAVGVALSFGMLRAWGFGRSEVTLAVALVGIWNQLVLLGSPALALALLTLTGGTNPLLTTVALIGLAVFVVAVALFAVALFADNAAQWVGELAARIVNWALRLIRRGPVSWGGAALAEFRMRAVALLRRRWWLLTLATLAGQITVFLVLLTCLRTLGVEPHQVSLVEAFAAWSISRLIGSLPLTPGGIGFVELGLTGTLVAFDGPKAAVVAAVLLYRFLTIVPTLVLGSIAALLWRRLKEPPTSDQAAAPHSP
jgi:putative heme transporter